MPEIFNIDDGPMELARRMGGRQEIRVLLESLDPGQVVVFGAGAPAPTPPKTTPNMTNRYVCHVQEMVARINRRPQRNVRLKSEHNIAGDIVITCYERGVYRGD